jgi:amino acid adenylation domain-containing protein
MFPNERGSKTMGTVTTPDRNRSAVAGTDRNSRSVNEAPGLQQQPLSASFAQERTWYWDRIAPNSPLYNVPLSLRISGALNIQALQRSLDLIVSRHEVLRTTYVLNKGSLSQVVQPSRPVELAVHDVPDVPSVKRIEAAQVIANRAARQSFDLTYDLMLRAALVRLSAEDHVAVFAMHHIASDGWSLGVFLRELSKAYAAYSTGSSPSLPDLPIQYQDFALSQRQSFQNGDFDSLMSYWKERLAGLPDAGHIMSDRPRPARQTFHGAREAIILGDSLVSAAVSLSQRSGASLFMTLLAVFQVLLHRYSGQDDIVVGFPIANRTQAETSDLIGCFANTLVFRGDLSGNPTFSELLARVRESALSDYEHQDLPYEKLLEALGTQQAVTGTTLFQSLFVFENAPMPLMKWPGLKLSRFNVHTGTAKFDLSIFLEQKDGLELSIEYNTDLFESTRVKQMLGHFQTLLQQVVAEPDRRIGSLRMLTDTEWRQIVVDWNQTQRAYPQKCVHELFEAQTLKTPDAPAILCRNEKLTYRQLNLRANSLATRLRSVGVTSGSKVAVLMERAPQMVVALLAVLKCGAAYLPLDPENPRDRLASLLRDSGAHAAITDGSAPSLPAELGLPVIQADDLAAIEGEAQIANVSSPATPDSLAYVIYTSGSTGSPKGVEVSHRGIARLIFGQDFVRFSSQMVFLQFSALWFDLSTLEIWGPLLHGGTCVLFPGRVATAHELGGVIRSHNVNTVWLTGSLFNAIIDEAPEALATVHKLVIGGEALSAPHVRRALKLLPNVELINGYGPTENTTFTSTYRIPQDIKQDAASISIGRPIANTTVYILDKYLQPVPVGVRGELYTGGPGISRGYLNRPELTAERFIANPFRDQQGEKLYRTGDTARYLSDGNIEFLGRVDDQVKIRGFRVELGEVEAAVSKCANVKAAAVIAHKESDGTSSLVAYVVPEGPQTLTVEALRGALVETLPGYMIPAQFVVVPSLPLLSSGKLNRRALDLPTARAAKTSTQPVASRNALEAELLKIWEQVLEVPSIGVRDDFFDLGGHSLKAVRMLAVIERTFGKRFDPSILLAAPTVEKLAAHLKQENFDSSLTGSKSFASPEITSACWTSLMPSSLQSTCKNAWSWHKHKAHSKVSR